MASMVDNFPAFARLVAACFQSLVKNPNILPHHGAGLHARPRRTGALGAGHGALAHRGQQPVPRRRAQGRGRAVHGGAGRSAQEPARAVIFAWTNAVGPASRFRNTVIGTLVQDLSEGVDVERAVELRAEGGADQLQAHHRGHHAGHGEEGDGDHRGAGPRARAGAPLRDHRRHLGQRRAVGRRERQARHEGRARRRPHAGRDGGEPQGRRRDEERAEDIGLEDFVEQVLPAATGVEVCSRASTSAT
jgi:hypothetical protein